MTPPDPAAKLTARNSEAYLWAAADIRRASIDSSDYKNFIFGFDVLGRAYEYLIETFADASEREIRKGRLQDDLVETVDGLPANLLWHRHPGRDSRHQP